MTTAILIVNYKTPWHLSECLKSIFENTQDFYIFLVHNSPDGDSLAAGEKFRAKYPDKIEISTNKENLGLVAGVNSVYEKALKYERVCFLNSDIIVTKDWLSELNFAMDSDDTVVQVAPDFNHYYVEPRFWRFVRYTISRKFPILGAKLYKLLTKFNPPRNIERGGFKEAKEVYNFCSGACNLVKTSCFGNRGFFFDPNIIHGYGDDFDTSFYLRKFGKIGVTNKSYVFHFVNVSFNKLDQTRAKAKASLQRLNRFYVVSKYADELKNYLKENMHKFYEQSDLPSEVQLWIDYFGICCIDDKFPEYLKTLPAKQFAKELGIFVDK